MRKALAKFEQDMEILKDWSSCCF